MVANIFQLFFAMCLLLLKNTFFGLLRFEGIRDFRACHYGSNVFVVEVRFLRFCKEVDKDAA